MTIQGPGIRIDMDPTLPGVRRIRFQPELKNTRAISIDKRHLKSLSKLDTKEKIPVVYLLLSGIHPRYVGISNSTSNRLRNHAANKKSWDRVIIFYMLIPKLNKSITENCEYKLFTYLNDCGIKLDQKVPSEISLSDDDSHIASTFISEIITILQGLGVDIENRDRSKSPLGKFLELAGRVQTPAIKDILYLKAQKTKGISVYLDPELRVEESAIIGPQKKSQSKSNLLTYKEMKRNGAIIPYVEKPNYWILTKPYVFSSPSAAASIIKGSPQNGMICWRNEKKVILKDLINKSKKK